MQSIHGTFDCPSERLTAASEGEIHIDLLNAKYTHPSRWVIYHQSVFIRLWFLNGDILNLEFVQFLFPSLVRVNHTILALSSTQRLISHP